MNNSGSRLFRIICLKRSNLKNMADFEYRSDWFESSDVVYWRANAEGYTKQRAWAGLYTAEDLNSIYGVHLDWLIDPISDKERRGLNNES